MTLYQQPPDGQQPGCREVWLLTRATFGVLMPVFLALIGLLVAIALALVLLSVHPALALLPVAGIVGGLVWLARREQRDGGPPEL